ncbi:MAG TPA: LuxR C-terminal-related transcriptional regulator [Puia sp.]|nr:LuxR C-terminal-related transcriptional regulator [Puia sp.]
MKDLLICDDHFMVRKGLVAICQTQFGLTSIDEASSCNELMRALKRKTYTHAIVDLVLSDGVTMEILPNIRCLYPGLQLLVFSMQPFGMYRAGLARYGITQFISKAAPERETFRGLQDFLYNSPGRAADVAKPLEKMAFDKLTPRETEVLHYLLMGMGSAEIGNILNMKQNTISTFKRRILEKSNTKNVFELKELAAIHKDVFELSQNLH